MLASIHNFGGLLRFILRRDRLYLPFWIIGIVTLAVFFTPMLPGFFGDEQSKAVLTEMMKNPAMVAMIGRSYGDGSGAMYALFMLVWSTLGAAIFNIFFVVRHTRKDEEEGRSEMLAALPVGHNANLLAVLVLTAAANLLIAALTAAIIPVFGIEGIGWQGAVAYSAALGAGGLVFAASTLLISQLFATSKNTTAVAFVILGAVYLLRAAGDMDSGSEVFSLISPLGLVERTQAWVANEVWPVFVLLAETLVLSVAALALSSLRDTGAGLFAQRGGRAHASAALRGEFSLAWRLTRGLCIGWAVVMFVLGASYGSILGDISSFMESNALYSVVIGSDGASQQQMMEGFLAFILLMMGIVTAIPVCMVVLKLKSEERRGRVEQILATSVNRRYLMSGYLLIALVLAVALCLLTPLGMYCSAATLMDSPPALGTMIKASLNYLPAVLALAGLAALLVGLFPKATPVVWIMLVYCFIMSYLGNIMTASATDQTMKSVFEALLNVSPFSLLPAWPGDDFNLALSLGMVVVALILTALGRELYRRRDTATG
jgi:ABC-2 type transport system permease protein